MYGVSRGPACILERLPEALACIVPCCIISREHRAREDQLPSDQQKDRQSHQIPKGGRGDRRRGGIHPTSSRATKLARANTSRSSPKSLRLSPSKANAQSKSTSSCRRKRSMSYI